LQLLSFRSGDEASFGALIEGRIVDLGRHLPEYDSLRHLLEANGIVRALDTAAEVSPDFRLDKVDLLAPLPDTPRLLCVFDGASEEPVSVDPKFIRGHGQPLRLPEGDTKPIAAGMAVALSMTEEGPAVLGYCLMSYLSPAILAAGPWLTTPESLPAERTFKLTVQFDEQSTELELPDPTVAALDLARERPLENGGMIAFLHYLPELTARAGSRIELDSPLLGTLNSPVEEHPG
jgi:hypothetical protein